MLWLDASDCSPVSRSDSTVILLSEQRLILTSPRSVRVEVRNRHMLLPRSRPVSNRSGGIIEVLTIARTPQGGQRSTRISVRFGAAEARTQA
jgi:hypothetical protein